MLEHQQPLDLPADARGSHPAGESGCRVQLAETGLLLLQSRTEPDLQDALTSEIDLRLPGPGDTCNRGSHVLLWITPAEWLLECPMKETDSLHTVLIRRLAGSLAVVNDMSDAFACFDVSGAQTHDVMMSACSLDLRTAAFPAGRVARTSLAGIPAIIRKTGGPHGFRCLVDRSYARHMRDWLLMITR